MGRAKFQKDKLFDLALRSLNRIFALHIVSTNKRMPIIVPKGLPAVERLQQEGIYLLESIPTDARPLRIMFLNIMPVKMATELDFFRALAPSPLYVEMVLTKLSGLTYKNTPQEYMDTFYTDFESLKQQHFDGFIITGAPLDHIAYESVNYWKQISELFTWARTNVRASLYVCWGALAGLYYHFGVQKHWMDTKIAGVYNHTILAPQMPLFKDFHNQFPMPNSRQTEVLRAEIEPIKELQIIAESEETGVTIVSAREGKEIFTLGHLEYELQTLNHEYLRDMAKGIPAVRPENYYIDDEETKGANFTWETSARLFYRNWLHEYVKEQ